MMAKMVRFNSPNNMVKPKASVVAAGVKRAIGMKPQRSYILGPDGKIKLVGTTPGVTKKKLSVKGALVPEEMTEEQLLLCSPTVLGLSFGDKLWGELDRLTYCT